MRPCCFLCGEEFKFAHQLRNHNCLSDRVSTTKPGHKVEIISRQKHVSDIDLSVPNIRFLVNLDHNMGFVTDSGEKYIVDWLEWYPDSYSMGEFDLQDTQPRVTQAEKDEFDGQNGYI
jgi:hypothetical protein